MPLNIHPSGSPRRISPAWAWPPGSPRYSSPWTRRYSRSTFGRSGGSMMTAPYMPLAMCWVIGMVEQW
ncbi:hypothetical protein [Streptosporangium pseudovulgare]|uniref:hypothetical protein n=1 Tax=Streptosporangium pseudovulgare TaxID=35765 RepID=UPI001E2F510E|nr:hypothetical protein [Streptosporangium pseudovulgare]